MKRIVCLWFIIIFVVSCAVGHADNSISSQLDHAVSQAVLDGCGDLTFWVSDDEPMFEVLVESHEVLSTECQGDVVAIWLLASAGVFRQNDDDGIHENPSKANVPLMLKFKQVGEDYTLIEYNEPAGGSWSDDVRQLFPEFLWEKAFAGNPQLFDSLESIADMYFTNPMSNHSWRTPIIVNNNDPALKAVIKRFGGYPQWEGRSILTRSQTDQLWYYLSIDGTAGYYSPCTFEKYDKDGNRLSFSVVQYLDDQLGLLEGEFPQTNE